MSNDLVSLQYIAPVFCVVDLGRSIAFYRDRLGFTVEFVYSGFYAGVHRDGCRLHLKCSPPAPRNQAGLAQDDHIDACVGVRSAEGLAADFAAAGVDFAVPLRIMPYGTEFYVRDPDGYVLGFVQPLTPEN